MNISEVEIKNFRLLRNVKISFEEHSTVIVGRNNSGKTSLTEIFRRLLSDSTPKFALEDFSIASIDGFITALEKKIADETEEAIRTEIPFIELRLTVKYDPKSSDLGPLSEFIIDLADINTVIIVVRYHLRDGKIAQLFHGFEETSEDLAPKQIREIRDRIPQLFTTSIFAEDPTDATNISHVDFSKFKTLFGAGFINAQRGLDDVTHTERDVLGKVLSKLFKTANSDTAPEDMKKQSEALDLIVRDMQEKVDQDFNQHVNDLLPALKIFGYPGLSDPNISTETTLDVENILDSHTKIRYGKGKGMYLPETYNGLGSRNLIYILFQLFDFFRDYQTQAITPGIFLIFIEEPEAHLHPQMQEVFIKQLQEIVKQFATTLNSSKPWPVQFIVSTHSTHIANAAQFESIRYFLTTKEEQLETRVKDLRVEFSSSTLAKDREFLHKYLTLTKCDLFFADKTILIEGPTERILMPLFVSKTDIALPNDSKLASQYISVIEVGGAYMHHFYKFLDFLELRALFITDLDSVELTTNAKGKKVYASCQAEKGTHTTNAGTKNWFDPAFAGHLLLPNFKDKTPAEKEMGIRRIAFQIPETGTTACGRSFEDAFVLANIALFGIAGASQSEIEKNAYELAEDFDKTDFAVKYALDTTTWNIPLYINEGLIWLSQNSPAAVAVPAAAQVATPKPLTAK